MRTRTFVVFTVAFGLALALSGCDRGDQPPSTPTSDQTVGVVAQGLKIINWGPDRTKAGAVFNIQPDGSAALWLRMDKSLTGAVVSVDFNGHSLTAAVQGDLVTTSVPSALYAAPGTYTVHVTVKQSGATVQSNDVKFVVE